MTMLGKRKFEEELNFKLSGVNNFYKKTNVGS